MPTSDAASVNITHWDDFIVGTPVDLGTISTVADEAATFDRAFVGPETGTGTSTSGMLLAALQMRLICDSYLTRAQGLGAPGIERLALHAPLAVGDRLSCEMTCLAKRPLGSRPGVGMADVRYTARRPDGEPVLTWRNAKFLAIRDQHSEVASQPADPEPTIGFETVEDTVIGLGSHTFTHAEIIAFAAAYDPQSFHLDSDAAKSSLFGALCASGWHTCAVWMRLFRDHLSRERSFRAFPEHHDPLPDFALLDQLKWRRPVFVDDTISFTSEQVGRTVTEDGRPVTVQECVGANSKRETVFSVIVYQPILGS